MVRRIADPSLVTSLACVLLCVLAPYVLNGASPRQKARSHRAVHRKPSSPVSPAYPCGPGLILRVSSPESSQGSLLLLELRSTGPLGEVKGSWDDKEIPFWQEDGLDEKGPDVWRALLGVDLELKAGEYPLTLTGKTLDPQQNISCSAAIAVKEGKFATESLRVAPNFVEPNPEQLARAEAERQRLRAIFATITPSRLWQGSFHVPLTGVTTGGNFGKRRILNGTPGSPHGGVDFPAPTGTPVHAAQRGSIVLAMPLYFSGNTVIIDHGLGLYTFYGHLDSIDAKLGDLVETGALIGKVGATGRVTGPHLHWGLTVNRSRANPLQLISLIGKEIGPSEPGQ